MIWENLHIYLFLLSVFIFVGTFAYIKLTYPFWSCQPVYHTYDIWRHLATSPGIISVQNRPTKFCDFRKVATEDYLDSDSASIDAAVDLLQCFFLSQEDTIYIVHRRILDALMTGHLHPSYISVYRETQYAGGTPMNGPTTGVDGSITQIQRPIGVVFSRTCTLKMGALRLDTYYVDQYAVHREKVPGSGSRGLVPAHHHVGRVLLQTHLHNVRRLSEIDTAILKTSEPYAGVVPLITFPSSLCRFIEIRAVPKLPAHFVLAAIRPENVQKDCLDFLPEYEFECMTGLGNLAAQLKEGIIWIYALRRKDRCYAMYFFRDSRVQYEKTDRKSGNVILELTNSVKMCQSEELYLRGLIRALTDIQNIKKGVFEYISIDHVSDNAVAVEYMRPRFVEQNSNYLYLYNYFISGVTKPDPRNSLILL
jgi:hypothetical protein